MRVRLTDDPALSHEQRPDQLISYDARTSLFNDTQFILLLVRELPQVDPYDLCSNCWCQILDFLRSGEQGFLVWISKLRSIGDGDVLKGWPFDVREVRLKVIRNKVRSTQLSDSDRGGTLYFVYA